MLKSLGFCSKCGGVMAQMGQRYCKACHAAYMREWRFSQRPTPEQRRKENSRAYANVYTKRGKLIPQLCEVCQNPAEKHHRDYSKPLEVRWLCRFHHLLLHKMLVVEH